MTLLVVWKHPGEFGAAPFPGTVTAMALTVELEMYYPCSWLGMVLALQGVGLGAPTFLTVLTALLLLSQTMWLETKICVWVFITGGSSG